MFHQSTSRTQRSKGLKVKTTLQLALLLAVVVWLLYQVKQSHDKKAVHAVTSQNNYSEGHGGIYLGRKGGPAGYNNGAIDNTGKVNFEGATERQEDEGGDDNLDTHAVEKVQGETLNEEHEEFQKETSETKKVGGGDGDLDRHTEEKVEDETLNKEHAEFEKDVVNNGAKGPQSIEERNADSQINGGDEANDKSNAETQVSKTSTEEASNKEHEESQEDSMNHGHNESEKEQQSTEDSNADSQFNGGNEENGKSMSEVEDTKESNGETLDNEHEGSREDITDNGENVKEQQDTKENNVDSQNGRVETTDNITNEVENSKESKDDISKQRDGMDGDSSVDHSEMGKGIHDFPDEKGVQKDGEVVGNSSQNESTSDDKQVMRSDQEPSSASINQTELTGDAILNENTKSGAELTDVISGVEDSSNSHLSNEQNSIEMPANNEAPRREAVESQEDSDSETETTRDNTPEETKNDLRSDDELADSSPTKEHIIEMPSDKEVPKTEATESQGDNGSEGEITGTNTLEDVKTGKKSDDEVENSSLSTEQTNREMPTDNDGPEKKEPQGDGSSEADNNTGNNLPEDAKTDPMSNDGTGSEAGDNSVTSNEGVNVETGQEDGIASESSNSVVVSQKENVQLTDAEAHQQVMNEDLRKEEF